MLESYRKMTNAHLRAHEENVMTFLRSDERFLDCEEDAAELGLSLSIGIHETYSAETKGLHAARGDKFPYGYSSELEIDFVRDGRVVMTAPKDGKSVQMSVTATIVRTPETMFLKKVELIPCGGGNPIDAAREQWSDASNTLAIAPGEVVVYSRNYVTNRILEENGVKIHTIPCSELSRGRGGPRCMSMPFVRDDLN